MKRRLIALSAIILCSISTTQSYAQDESCRTIAWVSCAPDVCEAKPPTGSVVGHVKDIVYTAASKTIQICWGGKCGAGTINTDWTKSGIHVLDGSITWPWFEVPTGAAIHVIVQAWSRDPFPKTASVTVRSQGEVDDVDFLVGDCVLFDGG